MTEFKKALQWVDLKALGMRSERRGGVEVFADLRLFLKLFPVFVLSIVN